MKFEFKPSENVRAFNEYINYTLQTSPLIKLYKESILPVGIIFIFFLLCVQLSQFYKSIIIQARIMVVIILILIFILFVINKLILAIKKKKNKIKNPNSYCDLDSIFKFSINQNYLLRENEFSTIKVLLSKIEKIKLLKYGLILCSEDEKIIVFIPKEILPINLNEFIDLFKSNNPYLIVEETLKENKKDSRKRLFIISITFILGIISSYFIGKYDYEYNYPKYNLVMQKDLQKENNNTYFYENDKLGLGIYFPNRWKGNYGIEELEDRINVYYLPEGNQSNKTTLIFTAMSTEDTEDDFDDFDDFYIVKIESNLNGFYKFLVPKKISTLESYSEEYKEYIKLYRDVNKLSIK